ncbi:MAG: putative DNA-binding domain-containing protein [Methylococcales bacterium]|nr:putative DNA-binding domain-containing protein [Methylococcales bacterium]
MKSSGFTAGGAVDFAGKQQEFAAYIRDPENNPAPADVDGARMAMYRALFFNNVDGFLSANFPVLRAILDDTQWLALVSDFFAKHASMSPYFSDIPEEFLAYLQTERDSQEDFPFLLELAHYEWVEMALSISREELPAAKPDVESLQNCTISLSPVAWPLAYQYPVHKIAPAFLPQLAPEVPTFLVVYRNQEDEVNFIEITPITYRLLEIIQEQGNLKANDYLQQVAQESGHPDPGRIIAGGLQILKELAEKTVIVVS